MRIVTRRAALAGSLAAGIVPRKPRAAEPPALPRLKVLDPSVVPPTVSFLDADGAHHSLKDYAGKGIVLNLWATWCSPCIAELPSLDTLAGKLAGQGVAVLPLSSDRGGASAVQRFYEQHGITNLPVLLDPQGAAMRAFGVTGIPATFLLDRNGLECAYVEGDEDWGAQATVARVFHLIGS